MSSDITILPVSERQDDGLHRTLSLPPQQRKNGRAFTTVTLRPKPVHEDILEEDSNHEYHMDNTKLSRSLFGSKSSRSHRSLRKRDIRVSTFNPIGVDIPDDVLLKIRNVEKKSLQDVLKTNSFSNGSQSHKTLSTDDHELSKTQKTKQKPHSNGLFKILQEGVQRITNLTTKHEPNSHSVIKTVEIIRNKGDSLGIFITKRKLSTTTDIALQSTADNNKHSEVSHRHGIFISRLTPNCEAARKVLVHSGDQILAVNTIPICSLDLKVVATMMCMLKRLILTVRTLEIHKAANSDKHNNLSNGDLTIEENTKHSLDNRSNHPSLSSLKEESSEVYLGQMAKDNNDNMTKVKHLRSHTAVDDSAVQSVYDNTTQDISNSNPVESENSLQIKFDESYQILLDAIAFCDKHKNINNNSSGSNCTNHKIIPVTTLQNAPPNLGYVEQRKTEGTDSLLSEIIDTMKRRKDIPEAKDPYLSMHSKYKYLDRQNSVEAERNKANDDYENINKFSANHDYDNLDNITSDSENLSVSESSSVREVNLDEICTNVWYSTEINDVDRKVFHSKTSSSSSSASSVGLTCNLNPPPLPKKMSAIMTSQSHNALLGEPLKYSTGHSNSRQTDIRPDNDGFMAGHITSLRELHKFPVNLDQDNSDSPLDTNAITVDKKRKWLNFGQTVSDELQKRLDGSSSVDGINVGNCANSITEELENNKPGLATKWFSGNAMKSNNTTQQPPTIATGIPRSVSNNSLGSVSGNAEFPEGASVRRKSSLRSPVEKSARSFLSVIAKSSNAPQSKSADNLLHVASTSPEKNSDFLLSNRTHAVVTAAKSADGNLDGVSSSKETSLQGKVASPSRPRRKNWGKKFTKKFKIGSSENAASEYSCWAADDQHRLTEGSAAASADQTTALKDSFIRRDPTLLSRYHLDISMAQQRRLSRRLVLETTARDPSHKVLSLSQFRKYKPFPMMNMKLPPVEGCLVLTLYGVRELKKTLCEAYCLVQVDKEDTKRIGTTMQTCRGATTWNQCFEMIVSEAKDLHLTVYTWDTRGGKHKVCSHASLNLPILIQGTNSCYRYSERLAISLEPRGTLYVKIALERNPSSPGPFLFGADLQSISERENSGNIIPSLVRSCIEEVEKRGMQVVGIYRLCGSAIVKKNLRLKLEKNQGDVDLTSVNYPDVNVITGILKDFLRELPQPLFSPELLEAVTAAMEKNPGPVPAAVVKEPFSPDPLISPPGITRRTNITDNDIKARTRALLLCVREIRAAPAEKATLYMLMNHLKKVSMFSDKNKMICQNLAVCFGPVLLGPVNSAHSNGMDLSAAIGFKRHIQVLNYMISNWPDEPVRDIYSQLAPVDKRKSTSIGEGSKQSNRVSLTRRLSRVYIVDEAEVQEEGFVDVLPSNEDDGVAGHRVSLKSIPEALDSFSDPDLDMYQTKSRHARVFADAELPVNSS